MLAVGIDLSLAATGLAAVSDRGWAVCDRIFTEGHRADDIFTRQQRLRKIRGEVVEYARQADLAVIERQIGKSTGSTHDRSGLWWMVVDALLGLEIPVADVPPTVLKNYVGLKGTASKTEVTAAVVKRYRDQAEVADDNEADALVLADMGARHLGFGLKVSDPKRSIGVLEKVVWP